MKIQFHLAVEVESELEEQQIVDNMRIAVDFFESKLNTINLDTPEGIEFSWVSEK